MNTVSLRLAMTAMAVVGLVCLEEAGAQNSPPPDRYNVNPFSNSPSGNSPAGNNPAARPPSDRYGLPTTTYPGGLAPPPGALGGPQNPAADSANSLRREIESGIQQANEQMSGAGNRFMDGARNVGQGFGSQFQDFTGSTTRQLELTGDNLRRATEETLGTAADGLRQVGDVFGVTAPAAPATPTGARGAAPPGASGGFSPPPAWSQNSAGTTAPLWSSAGGTSPVNPAATAPPLSTGNAGGVNSLGGTPRQGGATTPSSGWSVLTNDTAPPRLLTPSLTPPDVRTNTAGATGPRFPESSDAGRGTFHSPLVDPLAGNNAPLQGDLGAPGGRPTQDMSSAFPPPNPNATGDRFSTQPIFGSPTATAADGRATPAASNNGQDRGGGALPAANGANQSLSFGFGGQSTAPASVSGSGPGNSAAQPLLTVGNPGANRDAATPPGTSKQTASQIAPRTDDKTQPWMPLVLASLALVGSLSANLFLGWSYVDARQKYRTLVRKTADKFRRAAEAA